MSNTYDSASEADADRVQQKALLAALGAWDRALRRDDCGAWTITGSRGTIHTWGDSRTWVLFVACRSALHWTYTKRRLSFCTITQDGDDEGCLQLHHLPTPEQAIVIRDVLGIRKRQEISDATRERLRDFAFRGACATMGRPCSYAVSKVEEYRAIDLADLRRWKMLEGRPRAVTWTRDGRFTGFTGIEVGSHGLTLFYALKPESSGAAPRMAREFVRFVCTPTQFNGMRRWFQCPACGRGCRVLFGLALSAARVKDVTEPSVRGFGNFKCRRCRGLYYGSQYMTSHFRLMHCIEKQRVRLGGRPSFDGEFPPKPRTMHWRRYLALRHGDAAMREQLRTSWQSVIRSMRGSRGEAAR